MIADPQLSDSIRFHEDCIWVNGEKVDTRSYESYHHRRIVATLAKLHMMGACRIVELGGHPWVMSRRILEDPSLELCATVSAEELTSWPDDIGVNVRSYQLTTPAGSVFSFSNYSANIERTLFDLDCAPDTVIACEIVEHLIRSPHLMFLNVNHWLPLGGKLLVTTPNGSRFVNPLRLRSPSAAYRANAYERHTFLYTREGLSELVELCGFRIKESGFWEVYEQRGWSRVYGLLGRLPGSFWREKFGRTIYIVAEKERHVQELERCPKVYDPRGAWEHIRSKYVAMAQSQD